MSQRFPRILVLLLGAALLTAAPWTRHAAAAPAPPHVETFLSNHCFECHDEDTAEGVMVEEPRNGRFTEVVLRPVVTITADSDTATAEALHERAHGECFIANSVNFPVRCEPRIVEAEASAA